MRHDHLRGKPGPKPTWLAAASAALGYSKAHLSAVAAGKRQSPAAEAALNEWMQTNKITPMSPVKKKESKKKPAGKGAAKAPRIVQLDPVQCAAHELLERIIMRPALAAMLAGDATYKEAAAGETAEWESFCADVRMRGVQEPVRYIIRAGKILIVDGRHRWQAALLGELTRIPGIQVTEEEAVQIILGSVAHRRHMSKETVAYMAVLMYPQLAAVTRGGARQTAENAVCPPGTVTRQSVATQVGCSLRLIEEACATYKVLAEKPAARKKLEPLVIGGIIGLGAARAGAAGGDAGTNDNGDRRPSSFASMSRTFRSLTSQVRGYETWEPADREEAVKFITQRATEWPAQFIADLVTALQDTSAD